MMTNGSQNHDMNSLKNNSLATEVLLAGRDRVISFAGTSQFRVQGVSACGLAALNFARIAFHQVERNKGNISNVLNEIGTRKTVEEIISICAGWSSDLHLEVEDICRVPIFARSLKLVSTKYGLPRPKHFKHVLQDMQTIKTSAVVIITRPPEIIACFKIADATSDKTAFIVFDSHPRPTHPHGAGLSFSTSIEQTALTLSSILPVDEGLLASPEFQWQAQLLANCSGHVFTSKNRPPDTDESVIESSLAVLALRAEVEELKRQNKTLGAENERLETEVDGLKDAIRQEQRKVKQAAAVAQETSKESRQLRSLGTYSNAVAGPSRLPDITVNRVWQPNWWSSTGARSIFADNPPPVPATKPSTDELDEELAEKMQIDDFEIASHNHTLARQLQDQYNAEDEELRRQNAELRDHMQASFKCGICLEDHPEDDAAKVDDCAHMMCRVCLRGFLCSKIEEHRFPILCPICTAKGDERKPAVISGLLVEQVGITDEQYQIWIEMEMAQFSVILHCHKCNRSAFVDRQDHEDMQNIVCPLKDCNHVWCKACQQTIVMGGPKHSCDGSSELDHLMKERGWKYCPNCKTPIQKDSGCNHMMCISPGCNTHFCYVCGGMIVRSAVRQEVNGALSKHYEKCQLFEVPEDTR
ncbi:hypothetical protein HYDPIDRAFT_153660 [Hydnomerulius pinastri MD-312]|uniref:RBR-type E3 ubiquitin transferase n=1 Tax=Hydnomerulius pinastri MD-312 TaxID=994086 RepID=A0A0C9WFH3_9AGAM|nr:hypothetical protein HYDPIDRAFT_153660 [Hydnomerulius pinastri MD-312]